MIDYATNFCLTCENVSLKLPTWNLFTERQAVFSSADLFNNCIFHLNLHYSANTTKYKTSLFIICHLLLEKKKKRIKPRRVPALVCHCKSFC